MYGSGLDFTRRILITDELAASEPESLLLAVELASGGWHVVMMIGDVLFGKSDALLRPSTTCCRRSVDLIHELAHAWQSRHHGTDPTLPSFVKDPPPLCGTRLNARATADAATAASKLSGANKTIRAHTLMPIHSPPGNLGIR